MTATTPPHTAVPAVRRDRWGATAVFLLNGAALSSYIVRMPSLKTAHHLSDAGLGALGVGFAVAALSSMQLVGPIARRVGSAAILRVTLLVMPVLLDLSGVVSGTVVFAVV